MLIADGSWNRGDALLDSCVFFARGVRIHLMTTRGLTFDSRFLCPFQTGGDSLTLIALLEGRAAFRESLTDTPQERTRTVFRLQDNEYDRRHAGAPVLRLSGNPRRSLEIAVPRDVALVQTRLSTVPDALDPLVHVMANRALSHEERSAACIEFCGVLVREGFATGTLVTRAREALPPSMERVCQALISLYSRLDTGAYLELLAGLAGISPRQATRDMVTFLSTFPVPGRTFRELVKVLRIRRAALLLSASDVTVTSVARDVGYGGLDAMARAFRDAGLPAPSEVRADLRS
jgi:AraC-like DNA-binding protein